MWLLRLFLVLLLSLALPVQGIAGLVASEPPCPMAAAHDDAHALDENGAGDCCEEAAGSAGAGQNCKSGQECKSGSALQLPGLPDGTLPLARDALPLAPSASRTLQPAATIWRPPAVL